MPAPEEALPGRDAAMQGPGTVHLGRTFESPELVFVRSLEVDGFGRFGGPVSVFTFLPDSSRRPVTYLLV